MCLEVTSTSAPIAQSTGVLVGPISGDKIEVTYFGRREIVPDTAALNGSQLTLRYRNVLVGGQVEGLDVLTFVPHEWRTPPGLQPRSVTVRDFRRQPLLRGPHGDDVV